MDAFMINLYIKQSSFIFSAINVLSYIYLYSLINSSLFASSFFIISSTDIWVFFLFLYFQDDCLCVFTVKQQIGIYQNPHF